MNPSSAIGYRNNHRTPPTKNGHSGVRRRSFEEAGARFFHITKDDVTGIREDIWNLGRELSNFTFFFKSVAILAIVKPDYCARPYIRIPCVSPMFARTTKLEHLKHAIYRWLCPLHTLFNRPSRWHNRFKESSLSPIDRTKPQTA